MLLAGLSVLQESVVGFCITKKYFIPDAANCSPVNANNQWIALPRVLWVGQGELRFEGSFNRCLPWIEETLLI